MSRLATFVALCIAVLFAAVGTSWAAQYGTSADAKALLEKAVAAVKQDKSKALDMFNKGEGGFKDRDLYVSCANASDGVVTAHPYLKGEQLQDIKGKKGYPLGQEIMKKATEGEIKEVITGGRVLAQTRRWRRLPSTQKLAIRFAVSATTRTDTYTGSSLCRDHSKSRSSKGLAP